MIRAFLPMPADKTDPLYDLAPAWFVSFDGERFIETRNKPMPEDAPRLRAVWGATVDGPTRGRRRQLAAFITLTLAVTRAQLKGVVESFEEVPDA